MAIKTNEGFSITYHTNKPDVKLNFTDHTNTEYEVEECDLTECEYHETHADIFKRGLDPNINTKPLVYGVAKTLTPKTALINKMRADIDKANADLHALMSDYADKQAAAAAAAAEKSASDPAPDPAADKGGK